MKLILVLALLAPLAQAAEDKGPINWIQTEEPYYQPEHKYERPPRQERGQSPIVDQHQNGVWDTNPKPVQQGPKPKP